MIEITSLLYRIEIPIHYDQYPCVGVLLSLHFYNVHVHFSPHRVRYRPHQQNSHPHRWDSILLLRSICCFAFLRNTGHNVAEIVTVWTLSGPHLLLFVRLFGVTAHSILVDLLNLSPGRRPASLQSAAQYTLINFRVCTAI